VAQPRAAAAQLGARLVEYLCRVLLHNTPLTAPQDLAALLASYARDAKVRIAYVELPALAGVREALEQASSRSGFRTAKRPCWAAA